MATESKSPKRDAFHRHLDECAQCREHPFRLCDVGAPLLEQAAAELGESDTQMVWPPLDDEGFPF